MKQEKILAASSHCKYERGPESRVLNHLLSLLLHRDEGRNVSTADGARLLGLDELLAAVHADAEVAAGHDERVLGVRQTNQALRIGVVVLDRLLALFGALLVCQAVNRLYLEGKPVDLPKHTKNHASVSQTRMSTPRAHATLKKQDHLLEQPSQSTESQD